MAKEDGRPYRVDPATLETIGSHDFDGALKSETMTAHVRIDASTGELFFYGYEADGLASKKVAYCIVGPDGVLKSEQWFDAPYCAMMHDFTISENYALFPIYPTTADLERIRPGRTLAPRTGTRFLAGRDAALWQRIGNPVVQGPKGCHSYHMMNAGRMRAGCCTSTCLNNTNAFAFIREPSGIFMAPQRSRAR
jgi:carotenoid cleavage dioxygenase